MIQIMINDHDANIYVDKNNTEIAKEIQDQNLGEFLRKLMQKDL